MRHSATRTISTLAVSAVLVAACSSGDDTAETEATPATEVTTATTDSSPATTVPETPTTEPAPETTEPASETTEPAPETTEPAPETDDRMAGVYSLVEQLASDEMNGRDNQTPGSILAQELLVAELSEFAEPAYPDREGIDGYLQSYDIGTNVVAIVPGGELADEFVMIGAHYDHFANDCDDMTADDDICNGASDNAAGVAMAVDIARAIAAEGVPRRSVIVTLWDGEEDEFDGSVTYVADPVVPLAQTVGYVNMDLQGANLLPSLATSTIMVGAETGGPNLVESALQAREASTLDTVMLSFLFGEGRSDHTVLVAAGVPTVFFTDANNGCYHTVADDIDAVDFAKLEQQINTAEALTRDLVSTDSPPVFDANAPLSSHNDAVELLKIVTRAQSDLDLLTAEDRALTEQFLVDLQAVVDAGAEAFDAEANGVLLGGASQLVSIIRGLDCDPYIS